MLEVGSSWHISLTSSLFGSALRLVMSFLLRLRLLAGAPKLRRKGVDMIEFYKDTENEWRWKYVGKNGKIMGDSGEGYKNFADCRDSCNQVTGFMERHLFFEVSV